MEGMRRERKESAFFEAATGGNSSKTRLTELDTHFVASYTRMEAGGCADTEEMPMTEERSHRSSARKHGRDRSTREKKRCETADANDCERTPSRLCNSSRTVRRDILSVYRPRPATILILLLLLHAGPMIIRSS